MASLNMRSVILSLLLLASFALAASKVTTAEENSTPAEYLSAEDRLDEALDVISHLIEQKQNELSALDNDFATNVEEPFQAKKAEYDQKIVDAKLAEANAESSAQDLVSKIADGEQRLPALVSEVEVAAARKQAADAELNAEIGSLEKLQATSEANVFDANIMDMVSNQITDAAAASGAASQSLLQVSDKLTAATRAGLGLAAASKHMIRTQSVDYNEQKAKIEARIAELRAKQHTEAESLKAVETQLEVLNNNIEQWNNVLNETNTGLEAAKNAVISLEYELSQLSATHEQQRDVHNVKSKYLRDALAVFEAFRTRAEENEDVALWELQAIRDSLVWIMVQADGCSASCENNENGFAEGHVRMTAVCSGPEDNCDASKKPQDKLVPCGIPCNVDCIVEENSWSPVEGFECNARCGGQGVQKMRKNVRREAKNGGAECGQLEWFRHCQRTCDAVTLKAGDKCLTADPFRRHDGAALSFDDSCAVHFTLVDHIKGELSKHKKAHQYSIELTPELEGQPHLCVTPEHDLVLSLHTCLPTRHRQVFDFSELSRVFKFENSCFSEYRTGAAFEPSCESPLPIHIKSTSKVTYLDAPPVHVNDFSDAQPFDDDGAPAEEPKDSEYGGEYAGDEYSN